MNIEFFLCTIIVLTFNIIWLFGHPKEILDLYLFRYLDGWEYAVAIFLYIYSGWGLFCLYKTFF